jgi:hypothetical protein
VAAEDQDGLTHHSSEGITDVSYRLHRKQLLGGGDRHLFREVPGGVEAEDIVDYSLPLGPLGRLAHGLWVKRQLSAIFDYREAEMARLFPVTASQPPIRSEPR